MKHRPLGLALCAGLTCASLARADVLIVDDDGGAGVDFTNLQAAVLAAADGDTLLVKHGTYAPVVILGKSLHLVAEVGAHALLQSPTGSSLGLGVENLAAGQFVTLRGLTVASNLTSLPGPAVTIRSSQGEVWMEDCVVTGGVAVLPFPGFPAMGGDAVLVDGARLTAVRCTFTGGGVDAPSLPGSSGGDGLLVPDGEVRLHGCTLVGGAASSGPDCGGTAETAGNGATVRDDFPGGFLFAEATSFRGGDGGDGPGEDGANGGTGLRVQGLPQVLWLDSTFAAGAGGAGNGGCLDGAPGLAVDAPPGAIGSFAGRSYPFSVTSPVRTGATAVLGFEADPGDLLFLGFALEPLALLVPALAGVAHYDPFLPGTLLGATPATGTLDVPLLFGPLPPGVESVGVYLQSVVLTTGLQARLGAPSVLHVLDAAF